MAGKQKKKEKPAKATRKQISALRPDPGPITPEDVLSARSGLLEGYRTRWQHADWTALTQVGFDDISRDPDRAKLAALIASVHSAFGDPEQAAAFFAAAMDWGCDRRMAAQLMISAAQNTLGRANTAIGDGAGASRAFNEAIALVEPCSDIALLGLMRRIRETVNMGLRAEAQRLVDEQILSVRTEPETQGRRPRLIDTAPDLLTLPSEAMEQQARIADAVRDTPAFGLRLPRTIVVATQPRTGSTWVYNAVRLLLQEVGAEVYASWCEHYRGRRDGDTRTHVVKVHEENQLSFPYDMLITTHRDMADRLGSVIRMGWLKQTREAVLKASKWAVRMDRFWVSKSDLVIDFDQIARQPDRVILDIAHVLGIPATPDLAHRVSGQIRALQQPSRDQKYDPLTLLHPGHRSDGAETRELAAWVRSILNSQDHPLITE